MFFTQGRQRRLAVPRREGHDRCQGESRAGRRRVRQGVAVQAPRQQRRVRGEAALKGSDHRRAVAAPRAAGEVRTRISFDVYLRVFTHRVPDVYHYGRLFPQFTDLCACLPPRVSVEQTQGRHEGLRHSVFGPARRDVSGPRKYILFLV